jgi:hypothetical protein
MAKKVKKLSKEIVGTVVKITEMVTGTVMEFDFAKLPKETQEKLGPFGASHKLGDSAAGASGQEAVDSIKRVWDGLMKGDWSVRAPQGEKVSLSSVAANLDKLPPAEAAAARALLEKLGLVKKAAPAAPAAK